MGSNNSKAKGNISEAKALLEFQKYGIPVYLPWGDNERCDMIAEFGGKLNKIQVKTTNYIVSGAIFCPCRSSKNHTTNKELHKYNGEIDYFVFYNQRLDIIALVPIDFIGNKTDIFLRIEPVKNKQIKGINYFSDFEFGKVIKELLNEKNQS